MAFAQRVGALWRCDGCGIVAAWGQEWRTFGSHAEYDEGIIRWVSCSEACADKIPPRLRDLPSGPQDLSTPGMRSRLRESIERLRLEAELDRLREPS